MALYEIGERVSDHLTIEAEVTPKSFLLACSCGNPVFLTATEIQDYRSCGCQNPRC